MEKQSFRKNGWLSVILALLIAAVGVESYFIYSLHHRLNQGFSEVAMVQDAPNTLQTAAVTNPTSGIQKQANTQAFSNTDPFTQFQDPLAELWTIQHVMNEMSPSGTFAFYTQPDFLNSAFHPPAISEASMPQLHNTKKDVVIEMNVPGLKKSDIKTQIQGDNLTISGAQKNVIEKKQGDQVIANEQINRRFVSTLKLPSPVQLDKMKVDYNQNLLKITIPKA